MGFGLHGSRGWTSLRPGERAKVILDPGTYLLVYGADVDDTEVEATLVSTPLPPVQGEGGPEAG